MTLGETLTIDGGSQGPSFPRTRESIFLREPSCTGIPAPRFRGDKFRGDDD